MRYKTVWISDLHLGTRGCDAHGLLEFLRQAEFERLYLVGDVIDLWRLRKDHYWPQEHNDVVQKILRKGRKGVEIIVIPGNHDEFCSNFLGTYGNVTIKAYDVYTAINGQRLLVMHGHEFDAVTKHARWLAYLGDVGYTLLLRMNQPLNYVRRRLGWGYWSLSAYAKSKVKNAVKYISHFEEAVARYAQLYRVDGIVCGHIHTPTARNIRGVDYYNCGDWVENSTALVEHFDGRMELVRWKQARSARVPLEAADPAKVPALALELVS